MDDVGEYGGASFVAGVPPAHAGMIPCISHPLLVLGNHFLCTPGRAIIPDGELILKEQAGLVCDGQPAFPYRADADPKTVPVQAFGDIDEQLAGPRFVPRQTLRFGVLEKTMERDVRTAQEIHPSVQITALGGGVESELAHAKAGGESVTPGAGLQRV